MTNGPNIAVHTHGLNTHDWMYDVHGLKQIAEKMFKLTGCTAIKRDMVAYIVAYLSNVQ